MSNERWYNTAMSYVRELELEGSRLEKGAIIARSLEHDFMHKIYRLTYDPRITFGLQPQPSDLHTCIKTVAGVDDINEAEFFELLSKLRTRMLSGEHARSLVQVCFDRWPSNAGDLLWRILNKDLRCGISTKSLNAVQKGLVFEFSPMLCHPYAAKRVRTWPVTCEWKRDGIRTIVHAVGDEVRFMSRKGLQKFASMPTLKEEVLELLLASGMKEIFLDGELTRGDNFNSSSAVKSHTQAFYDVNLHLFEILTPEEFTGEVKTCWDVRQLRMAKILGYTNAQWVASELQYWAHDEDGIMQYYREVRMLGGEGIIVKQHDGLYLNKRGYEWMKIKNVATIDLRVKGVFEGTGRNEGRLGGFIVEDSTGREICKVGGGFSDSDRAQFWTQGWQEENIPCIIEIEYQDFTPDGSLRSPQFVRIRDDKAEPDEVPQ